MLVLWTDFPKSVRMSNVSSLDRFSQICQQFSTYVHYIQGKFWHLIMVEGDFPKNESYAFVEGNPRVSLIQGLQTVHGTIVILVP